jgi:hypothetical protein
MPDQIMPIRKSSLLLTKYDPALIPELPKGVKNLIGFSFMNGSSSINIVGENLNRYQQRNELIIQHFDSSSYPENVHLLKSKDVFCDEKNCFAVRDGSPLYFDDNHPSIIGANLLVDLVDIGSNVIVVNDAQN